MCRDYPQGAAGAHLVRCVPDGEPYSYYPDSGLQVLQAQGQEGEGVPFNAHPRQLPQARQGPGS